MTVKKDYKVWRATNTSKAGFVATPDTVKMLATPDKFIAIDNNGLSINGPLSINSTSEQIRQGGLFTQMPDFVRMIPPTIMTPIPSQMPFPPLAFAAGIVLMIPVLLALRES
jgi:hypothetical protein